MLEGGIRGGLPADISDILNVNVTPESANPKRGALKPNSENVRLTFLTLTSVHDKCHTLFHDIFFLHNVKNN